jgi:hypothetical protein
MCGALARIAGVELEIVRDADPAIAPAPARLGPARLEPLPVGQLHRAIERGPVVAAVVDDAQAVGVRHGPAGIRLRRRSSSRSKPWRRAARSISRSITNMTSGRPALRYGVVGDVVVTTARAAHRHRRHVVHGGRDRHALVERVERDGVGTDVAGVDGAKATKVPCASSASSACEHEIAPVIVGQERLPPLAVHFTGRPTRRAAQATSANSG